ncbi:MAG: STAS-like domain-containing protein [Nanoarchaeota archaeon]
MKLIKIYEKTGSFAENKDIARDIRVKEILPCLDENEVLLDFEKVESATQSFIHALISDIIRKKGINILDRLYFKNCNDTVKKIISIVTEYMQQQD